MKILGKLLYSVLYIFGLLIFPLLVLWILLGLGASQCCVLFEELERWLFDDKIDNF